MKNICYRYNLYRIKSSNKKKSKIQSMNGLD